MTYLLKLHAWPVSRSAAHWRSEAGIFMDDADQRFTPSMRQRTELDELYTRLCVGQETPPTTPTPHGHCPNCAPLRWMSCWPE